MRRTHSSSSLSSSSSSSSSSSARALVKHPPSRLTCTICQEVFVKPVHSLPCCHCFCENCIVEWNKTSSTCPICRESLYADKYGNCILKKALLVSELIEELEVHCKFGVKCTVDCQAFGVIGSEFVELPDGCTVKMTLKNIQSHEETCPYGKSLHNVQPLIEENEGLREYVRCLAKKIGSQAVTIQRISSDLEEYKEKYEEARVIAYDSYRYEIEDARHFSRLLAHNMFGGENLDRSRCFTALQRLAGEWERRQYEYAYSVRETMHYLFYTATMCNFWTEKQQPKLEQWRDEFSV